MLESLRHYACVERLPGGQSITIRAAHQDDGPKILRAFSLLDSRTRYMRFLAQKARLSDQELHRLTDADFENAVVLLATIGQGQDEVVIAGRAASSSIPGPRGAKRKWLSPSSSIFRITASAPR
ncbi:MAG: hypothetical protein WAK01_20610 [Methylocystis sp.]